MAERYDSYLYKTEEECKNLEEAWYECTFVLREQNEYFTTEKDKDSGMFYVTNRYDPNCDNKASGYIKPRDTY